MAIDSISNSTLGAAVSLRQAQGQADFGVKALSQNAAQQQQTVASLVEPAGGGGNVTATRGQNLNIVV